MFGFASLALGPVVSRFPAPRILFEYLRSSLFLFLFLKNIDFARFTSPPTTFKQRPVLRE